MISLLEAYISGTPFPTISVNTYCQSDWRIRLSEMLQHEQRICLIHDYTQLIGGAEFYINTLETALLQSGKNVSRYSYPGTTTLWKRRWMFIFSLFSFWRGYQIYTLLVEEKPQVIWLHSVMRYIGFWGILAISLYTRKYPSRILFSHHDLGSLAPFVQSVTEESDIPTTFRIRDFIEHTS